MVRKAIYPGSFDPFTNGHLDIVRKASKLFDEVYVVIGTNKVKKRSFSSDSMKDAIEKTMCEEGITNVCVFVYEGLIAEFSKKNGIQYMIRGLRNNMDYNYEENIAEANKLIYPELEYIYFRAENIALSSSMVKELHSYDYDIKKYVPSSVYECITARG